MGLNYQRGVSFGTRFGADSNQFFFEKLKILEYNSCLSLEGASISTIGTILLRLPPLHNDKENNLHDTDCITAIDCVVHSIPSEFEISDYLACNCVAIVF